MGWLEDAISKYAPDANKDGINDSYDWGINGGGTKDTDGDGKLDMDCSHLVNNILREAGYNLPNHNISSTGMAGSGYYEKVSGIPQVGDVIYFPPPEGKKYGHVGIVTEINVSYDPITGKPIISGKFFGSQESTGPAITDFGPNSWFGTKRPVGDFLRPNIPYLPIDDIKKKVNTASVTTSPIILDLDGDGNVNTLGKDAGIHFDHDGDGFKELTGWVAPGDGVLMLGTSL